jgi:NTE family protein
MVIRTVIVTPAVEGEPSPFDRPAEEIEVLGPERVHVVFADATSVKAFGTNPLSPDTRPQSARAGREIGRARAADVAAFWSA